MHAVGTALDINNAYFHLFSNHAATILHTHASCCRRYSSLEATSGYLAFLTADIGNIFEMGSGLGVRNCSSGLFFITTSPVISDLNARANNSTKLLTDSDAFGLHVRLILAQSFVYSIKPRDQNQRGTVWLRK
jgi:hypothetical protein